MAGSTYVNITREDFEEWLDSLKPTILGWTRASGTTGVYLAHFSEDASLWISSSIASSDANMGKDQGSMSMRLVSRHNNKITLNKKDVGQGKFYRTMNWRDKLSKAVRQMRDAYLDSKVYYDKLSKIEDRVAYQREWMSRIKNVPGYENNTLLRDLLVKLGDGVVLSDKQEQVILQAKKGQGEARSSVKVDQDMVNRLTSLIKSNQNSKFWQSLLDQVQRGYSMTSKQLELIEEGESKLRRRESPPPSRVVPELVARIETLMKVMPNFRILPDFLEKANEGYPFTPKMMRVLETAEGAAKDAKDKILARTEKLLRRSDLEEGHRAFLVAVKAKLVGGRHLGPREMEHLLDLESIYRSGRLATLEIPAQTHWMPVPA